MHNKLFILFFAFLFLCVGSKSYAMEKPQVLIINQVRGEECCDKGNLENLKKQVETSTKLKIPAYFVLRYDALNDSKYTDYLKKSSEKYPDLIKLGLFLEITPNLAKNSGISYKGMQENWFSAENLLSIGYSNSDNEIMMNTLFSEFKKIFGYYPEVSSSWMIKTDLLNYIKENYGVRIHQITREQIGVDSYNLDGGPPHYPYPASSRWALIPDYQNIGALIVRQTITDPLYNYGDSTSSFTSQPNDYLRDKHFEYFKKLLDQTLFHQSQTGFALLGLENSMPDSIQKEFVKQLELIKTYKDRNLLNFPNANGLYSFWSNNKVSIYQGSDLVDKTENQAYWITTPGYRLRIRTDGNKVFISDIRIYNSSFPDPYENTIAQREGHWIIPFLINGSLIKETENKKFNLFNPQPMPINQFATGISDASSVVNALFLPDIKKDSKIHFTNQNNELEIGYESGLGQVKLMLKESSIATEGIKADKFIYKNDSTLPSPVKYLKSSNGFSLYWLTEGKNLIGIKTVCLEKSCNIAFEANAKLLNSARKSDYEFLFPETTNHQLNLDKTIVYPNNKYAIYGRNPVRIILIPYDKFGLVTTLPSNFKINTRSNLKTEKIIQGKRYFIDIYSKSPISEKVELDFGDSGKSLDMYFAPNCKKEFKLCLSNPKYLWWYINAISGDKIRQIIYKEKQ